MKVINFTVYSYPVTSGNKNHESFRKDIERDYKKKYKDKIDLEGKTKFKVTITLFLDKPKLENNDLDNSAKYILDTLFKCKKSKYPNACFSNGDDNRVFKLILIKRDLDKENKEKITVKIEEYN